MDEQEPQEEEEAAADEEEEAEPAPKKEKKKKAKRTDRLTDKAALDAKLKEDNWQITEKPLPTKEGGARCAGRGARAHLSANSSRANARSSPRLEAGPYGHGLWRRCSMPKSRPSSRPPWPPSTYSRSRSIERDAG